MSEYQRTTRECALTELSPELLAAIRRHVAQHDLDDPTAQALICCETTSVRTRQGFLSRLTGGSARTLTGVVVTPRLLIWAMSDPRQGAWALSARLADIEVKDYDPRLIVDHGIEVFGFLTSASEKGLAFIGLGPEPAAQHFTEVLKAAVRQVQDGQPVATPS